MDGCLHLQRNTWKCHDTRVANKKSRARDIGNRAKSPLDKLLEIEADLNKAATEKFSPNRRDETLETIDRIFESLGRLQKKYRGN